MSDDLFFRLGLRVLSKLSAGGESRTDPPLARVILVTSARSGEGKTHVSQGLARALAQQCSQAVVCVSTSVQAGESGPGWSELVHQPGGPAAGWPTPDADTGLTRLPAGQALRPDTLFRPEAVAQALVTLRSRYAWVVIDGPSLADGGALLDQADGLLLVVNASQTRRQVVQGALAAHPVSPERWLGAVLNQRPEYVPQWFYRWAL